MAKSPQLDTIALATRIYSYVLTARAERERSTDLSFDTAKDIAKDCLKYARAFAEASREDAGSKRGDGGPGAEERRRSKSRLERSA